MFFPEGQVRIFVYGEPVNMRLSYDGLYAKIRNVMGRGAINQRLGHRSHPRNGLDGLKIVARRYRN
jgi:hypothetical protein